MFDVDIWHCHPGVLEWDCRTTHLEAVRQSQQQGKLNLGGTIGEGLSEAQAERRRDPSVRKQGLQAHDDGCSVGQ
jgi:hypothetical protein